MKKYLVCIDSDGCAIDTMTLKHEEYFGPYAAEEFKFTNYQEFVEEWNRINLYSIQRGINRFESLALFLEKYRAYIGFENLDIRPFTDWVKTTKSLSEVALAEEIRLRPARALDMALKWSKRVNSSIAARDSKDYKAFANVKDQIKILSKLAHIVVVSSANKRAVLEEWENNDIINYPKEINTQEDGSKKDIIKRQLVKGYDADHILMIGDAVKDRDAALDNGVLFYPILAGKEEKSWADLSGKPLEAFLNGKYREELQEYYLEKFIKNLT